MFKISLELKIFDMHLLNVIVERKAWQDIMIIMLLSIEILL
jgi:hypothetical protein